MTKRENPVMPFARCNQFFILSYDIPQPTQSQLIQIYSVDWTDDYDTHTTLNIGQNQLAIKVSADKY